MRCFLDCSTTIGKTIKAFNKRSHWHCYLCTQLFRRITEFRAHLAHHEKKLNPPVKTARKNPAVDVAATADHSLPFAGNNAESHDHACSECGKRLLNKHSLQRHVREVHKKKREGAINAAHYLTGICVDFNKGIFMVRRSFSGITRPVHCQHSTYAAPTTAGVSACELNECRGAAVVARLSGHPAFECVHLQSVQYAEPYQQPITLTESSLHDLVQKVAWFKESKSRDCLSLKEKADHGGHPLIVPFPRDEHNSTSDRFWYFSVFDGGIHYWSRFGRVIVGFDKHNVLWMCECCRAKRSCIHKSVAKWFVYELEPSLLSEARETEEFDEAFPSDEVDDEASDVTFSPNMSSTYPPTGTLLEEMVRYQRTSKRLPSSIPPQILTDTASFPDNLIPCEEMCHLCSTPLEDPCEITNRAVVIGLTKVSSGNLLS